MNSSKPQNQRCAIYTRVSTDAGLEQEFNSLDAQREASAAYVKSQAQEGWRLIKEHYDDGGYSGGSVERPALQRLLADIREMRIDVVVVYKVDRLTRSLADFAKLVELFDEHRVSFVSVTQSFNTTTSMGRLTLNMLLSFAQFEREVTGERIRDKIAASKKKGLWVGGVIPLGYDVKDKKLIVKEEEAPTVRMIFQRYLTLGSLPALQRELKGRGVVTRVRNLSTGRTIGGRFLTNGPLAYMLRNRVYLGEINHRGKSYPGEHAPILDTALFDAVQAKLNENRIARRSKNEASRAPLFGKLYDDRGNRMTPSYAIKKGVRYHYYVSCVLAQGRKDEVGSVPRIAAAEIERLVLDAIATHGEQNSEQNEERGGAHLVERIVAGKQSVDIRLTKEASMNADRVSDTISVPWSPKPFRRKREILQPSHEAGRPTRSIRIEARTKLLDAIANGRQWLNESISDPKTSMQSIAMREGIPERSARSIISLAFLAPDIVKGAVDGTLPRGFGLSRLIDLPARWTAQRSLLGLADPAQAEKNDPQSVR
jgi:site-specific DNA recombinase